jgi:peptidoglycan/xylan/chitin deacetylase (PgdA/CDA1 family)
MIIIDSHSNQSNNKTIIFLFIIVSQICFSFSYSQTKNNFLNVERIQKNQNTPSSIGQVIISTWANWKKAAFSFSFDDGLQSQYDYVRPIMNSYGFHATYYVISSVLNDSLPANWRYGLWSEFQQLAVEGNEIGDHTVTHPDLTKLPIGDETSPGTITYELYQSKKVIEQKIPGVKIITLAYPYCIYNQAVESVAQNYFEAARSCGSYVNDSNISGSNWYSIGSSDIQFNQPRNSLNDDQDEFNMYTNILQNQTIANGKWTVFLAHEVLPFDQIIADSSLGLYYPVSTEWLTELCQWIKQKSDSSFIWVATVGNVVRYIKERENFSYVIAYTDSTKIQIVPTDILDDSIYNYPLSAKIVVPTGWKNIRISQGSKMTETTTQTDSVNTFANINIIPDGGVVTISNSNALFELSGIVTYNNKEESPLVNVVVSLSNGGDTIHTVTDAKGKYSFINLNPGTYILYARKDSNWGGVNSTDALLVQKYSLKKITLDSLQMKAADVDNNGFVDSKDALRIAERFVGQVKNFNIPDWVFSTPVTVTLLNASKVQNIKGLTAGDINKSYIP